MPFMCFHARPELVCALEAMRQWQNVHLLQAFGCFSRGRLVFQSQHCFADTTYLQLRAYNPFFLFIFGKSYYCGCVLLEDELCLPPSQ